MLKHLLIIIFSPVVVLVENLWETRALSQAEWPGIQIWTSSQQVQGTFLTVERSAQFGLKH